MRILRAGGGLDHAMQRRFDSVVCPAREQVARVDDDGVSNGCGVYKGAFGGADLQAAAFILEE